jgi:hypothetical protein
VVAILKNYHHFKKTSRTILSIREKKEEERIEDLILRLRIKEDNKLFKSRTKSSNAPKTNTVK